MAKMGRPVKDKDEKKDKVVGIRFSQKDYSRLMAYASRHNMTITKVIQEALEKLSLDS